MGKNYKFDLYKPSREQVENQNLWIAAIDPALKNCAVRIEERQKEQTTEKPETKKRTKNPKQKPETNKKIQTPETTKEEPPSQDPKTQQDPKTDLSLAHPRTIYQNKFDFTKGSAHVLENITAVFQSIAPLLQKCTFILIESQLRKSKIANLRAFQHIVSFCLLLSPRPMVIEVDAKLKSHPLTPRKFENKYRLKKWAVEKAMAILAERKDEVALAVMKRDWKKRDDHADTICYIEAFFRLLEDDCEILSASKKRMCLKVLNE